MTTLALDTSTPGGGVAVARGGRLLSALDGDRRRSHGERLPADLLRALLECGLSLADVTRFAVVLGPGGFTGLRVGIATIQGLAVATGHRVVGMSALEAMALAGVATAGSAWPPGHRLAVLMDGGRGDCFGQAWTVTERDGALDVAPLAGPLVDRATSLVHQWMTSTTGPSWCVADEALAGAVRDLVGAGRVLVAPPNLAPVLALRAAAAPESATVGPHGLQPIYVRRPDAVVARERRAGVARGDA